jgi:hypothetical protein
MIEPLYSWNQEGLPEPIYRYRTTWRGKLVLQIAEARRLYSAVYEAYTDKYEWQWRDATTQDITNGKVI